MPGAGQPGEPEKPTCSFSWYWLTKEATSVNRFNQFILAEVFLSICSYNHFLFIHLFWDIVWANSYKSPKKINKTHVYVFKNVYLCVLYVYLTYNSKTVQASVGLLIENTKLLLLDKSLKKMQII